VRDGDGGAAVTLEGGLASGGSVKGQVRVPRVVKGGGGGGTSTTFRCRRLGGDRR
jgi:hypothetical protein